MDFASDVLIQVSEREVSILQGEHVGKVGLVNAVQAGQPFLYRIEMACGAEVTIPPEHVDVTGNVDEDFELESIEDQNGDKYLCAWMATLMSPAESGAFEEDGYTLHEVVGSRVSKGSYRVVQWEPTWEEVEPNPAAATR